jgi:hypothetical protein
MFIHSTCKSPIYIDLSSNITFLVSFGVAKTGLKLGQGDISFMDDKFEPDFYCVKCKNLIPVIEIEGSCSHCGDLYKIDSLFKSLDSGGIYCSKCIKLLPDETTRPLSVIFSKVLTGGL